ncbi:MAG: aminoglycoside phosphotransferase family protein [Gemmatimonadetes bacterium]|nr:aminoglycoside phosphotransferase family protein [Gemmatimonadota bacterium]
MPADADRALAAREDALPGLADVLTPTRDSAWWRQVCPDAPGDPVVSYVKYKPGQSCLAGVVAGNGARYIVKAWRPSDPAMAGYEVVDAARAITVTRFPHDAKVRGSRWLHDEASRDRAHERLGLPTPAECTVDLLAWKPERRAVYRVSQAGTPIALVKCHTASAARAAEGVTAALQELPFPTPLVRGSSARRGAIAYHWIAGHALTHDSVSPDQCRKAGQLLAALHTSSGRALGVRDAGERHQRLRDSVAALTMLLPDVHAAARDALAEIERRRPAAGPPVPTHGDFYVKQLLDTGDGLACLDFDEAAMGDASDDLAVFVAHIERDVARGSILAHRATQIEDALLDGYGRHCGSLDLALAEHLLGLVHHPFRHRAADWAGDTRALVDRVRFLLARGRAPGTPSTRGQRAVDVAAPLLDHAQATAAVRAGVPGYPNAEVTSVRVERHKAGRRTLFSFVVRATAGAPEERWLAKARARGTDHRTAALQQSLWDAGLHSGSSHGVSVPALLGVLEGHHALVQRWVGGIPLPAALADGCAPAIAGRRVARALEVLHGAAVHVARRWTIDDELGMLEERLTALATARPSLAAGVARLWHRLVPLAAPLRTRARLTLVHRDFYHDQLLFDGERTWILDLDCAARGDPAMDVGNFAAHLVEGAWRGEYPGAHAAAVIQSLLDDYTRDAAQGARDAVARWTALSLARLLEIALHHDARRASVPELLDRLLHWLPARARGVSLTPPALLALEVA